MYYAKRKDGEFYDWLGHTLDVAACMHKLLQEHVRLRTGLSGLIGCSEELLTQWLVWAAVRHDLGKLTQAFQEMIVNDNRNDYTVRHDSLGWVMWRDSLSQHITTELAPTADILVRAATGHHGSPPRESHLNRAIRITAHANEGDLAYAMQMLGELDRIAPLPTEPLDTTKLEKATWWIAGVQVVADWLGSNVEWFPYTAVNDLELHWSASLKRAVVAIEESGVVQSPLQAPISMQQINPSWETRPLQSEMERIDVSGPVCAVVEDAMGAGKTEAALILGGRLIRAGVSDRLFWALPTVATSNSLYNRLSEYCPDAQRTLVHGYPIKLHSEHATPWLLSDNRRRLFAPLSVGTIDQVMLGAMYSKYSVLRLIGIVGSVIVFDEIHAADGYMLTVIKMLVELHAMMGGSVIFLSATLPQAYRTELIAAWQKGRGHSSTEFADRSYPVLAYTSGSNQEIKPLEAVSERQVRVIHEPSVNAVKEELLQQASQGRCAAWICTTVDEAVERYLDLRKELGDNALLFHSRYVAEDRNAIEQKVIEVFGKASDQEIRAGKVLIATQVVEQSLDLDFDFMVSDAAPVDLILQRVGRLHRHERGSRGTPTLMLHAPRLDDSWDISAQYVYKNMMPHIWLSVKLLQEKGSIQLPSDLRGLVECVYAHSGENTPLGALVDPEISARDEGRLVAVKPGQGYQNRGRQWLPDTAYQTRLGESSQIVAIVDDEGIPIRGSLPKSAVRFLHRWMTEKQMHQKDGWSTTVLNSSQKYSRELGLQLDNRPDRKK